MSPLASRQKTDATQGPVTGALDHVPDFVHPETGLANDYLNIFNELVMLLEVLPSVPDFRDEVFRWKPVSYIEYFNQSPLPNRQRALECYSALDAGLRARFDKKVADLNAVAVASVKRLHQIVSREPKAVDKECGTAAARLRALLDEAARIVNNGEHRTHVQAQKHADRLVANRKPKVSDPPLKNRPARG